MPHAIVHISGVMCARYSCLSSFFWCGRLSSVSGVIAFPLFLVSGEAYMLKRSSAVCSVSGMRGDLPPHSVAGMGREPCSPR